MKVNVNVNFKTLDGKDIPANPQNIEEGSMNLKNVCVASLLAPLEEEKLDGNEKAKRYSIAQTIYDCKEGYVELSVEDISLLKKLIGNMYLPLIVGQAYSFLEGNTVTK